MRPPGWDKAKWNGAESGVAISAENIPGQRVIPWKQDGVPRRIMARKVK